MLLVKKSISIPNIMKKMKRKELYLDIIIKLGDITSFSSEKDNYNKLLENLNINDLIIIQYKNLRIIQDYYNDDMKNETDGSSEREKWLEINERGKMRHKRNKRKRRNR